MKALLIIDMQIGYFKTPGLVSQQSQLINDINGLAASFTKSNDLILNVKTIHSRDRSTWTLNMLEDEKGFVFDGSQEAENVDGLHVAQAIELTKTRDSAFTHTRLEAILNEYGVKQLTLAGVSAHSCIFLTAAEAYALNFSVSLADKAIGDEDENLKQETFNYLKREYRQEIV